MTERVLYISYDGMLEPLGQSQVLGYLEKLAPGREIHLISFEKRDDWKNEAYRVETSQRIERAGISWHPLPWRNRPRIVSAVYNLLVGMFAAINLSIRYKLNIFHARNILCSAMCLPAVVIRRGKLLSDIRGFWSDERVDAGLIGANGIVYRVLKLIERRALRRSSAIVTLTKASVPYLKKDPRFGCSDAPITVIPTCVDLDRFRLPARRPPRNPFVLGYVGQFGTWYMLEETIALFAAIRAIEPDVKLLIANRNEHQVIRAALDRHGIPQDRCEITAARHAEVSGIIGRMHAAACFVRPQFSKISSAPTKFAEYLACGVPVVATTGVGDLETIITDEKVGLLARDFDPNDLARLARGILTLGRTPSIAARCRSVAERLFSLEGGVGKYRAIYERLGRGE